MINEQELDEAVDRLREGERVLGITAEDITTIMSRNHSFSLIVFNLMLEEVSVSGLFEEKFNEIARYELREALRAKQEVSAGC